MNNFDLLEKIIMDMCKTNKIGFIWTNNDPCDSYVLSFKKSNKMFNFMINRRDMCMKPFALIKAEIEHVIREFIKETESK